MKMALQSENILRQTSRLLLVRTDRIGDVILSTPAATALHQRFSLAEIHFLLRRYTLPLVEDHPAVTKSWMVEEFPDLHSRVRFLRQQQFTSVIFLHPEPDWALAAFLARIPLRIGSGYRAYSLLFNRRIYVHRKFGERHEADLNMDLLQPLGIDHPTVTFEFTIPPRVKQQVDHLLTEQHIKQPFVVLHSGSGGSALDWPLTHFAELADLIDEQLRYQVVLTGAASEAGLIDQMQKLAKRRHHRLDGQLDLKQLAALLQRAETVVANSTGPLHLAVAVGTPVVGLYCPIRACHPDRWGPYGNRNAVLLPPVAKCKRCRRVKCEHFNCMELISVADVLAMVRRQATGKKNGDKKEEAV